MKQAHFDARAQGATSLRSACASPDTSRKLSVSRMIDWLKDQRAAAVERKRSLLSALKQQEKEIADFDQKLKEFTAR